MSAAAEEITLALDTRKLTMVLAHHAHTHRDVRRMGLWLLAAVLQGRGRLWRRSAAG